MPPAAASQENASEYLPGAKCEQDALGWNEQQGRKASFGLAWLTAAWPLLGSYVAVYAPHEQSCQRPNLTHGAIFTVTRARDQ
jgi:hypothetical protein